MARSIPRGSGAAVGYFQTIDSSARTLQALGYTGPKLAVLMDRTRVETAEGSLEDCVFPKYPDPDDSFSARYAEQYKVQPGISSDTAYDSVMSVADAVRKAGSAKPQMVQPQLLTLERNGASGHIRFDSQGGITKKPLLFQVKEGAFVKLMKQ